MQENIVHQIFEVGFTRAQKLEPQEPSLFGVVPDLLHKCHSYFVKLLTVGVGVSPTHKS